MTEQRPEIVFQANSPGKMLSAVPNLLGYNPKDNDLVLLGLTEPRETVALTLRVDVPPQEELASLTVNLVAILAQNKIPGLAAVYYGSDETGRQVSHILRGVAAVAGVYVKDILRVADGRYWSYVCTDATCCAPEGTPFVIEDFEGFGSVLADREALAKTVAPRTDAAAEAMRKEVIEAAKRLKAQPKQFIEDNLGVVPEFIENYRGKNELVPIGVVADLLVALADLRVRDDAWARMDPKHAEAHIRLWTHLTRIAPPGLVAAPASLLAFVAWQNGNGALAHCALDRALADDPTYSMADLLRQVISAGAPPSLARLPMSPEEVAASYDEQEKGDE